MTTIYVWRYINKYRKHFIHTIKQKSGLFHFTHLHLVKWNRPDFTLCIFSATMHSHASNICITLKSYITPHQFKPSWPLAAPLSTPPLTPKKKIRTKKKPNYKQKGVTEPRIYQVFPLVDKKVELFFPLCSFAVNHSCRQSVKTKMME